MRPMAILASLMRPMAMFACLLSHAAAQPLVCCLSDSYWLALYYATECASLFTQMSTYLSVATSCQHSKGFHAISHSREFLVNGIAR